MTDARAAEILKNARVIDTITLEFQEAAKTAIRKLEGDTSEEPGEWRRLTENYYECRRCGYIVKKLEVEIESMDEYAYCPCCGERKG